MYQYDPYGDMMPPQQVEQNPYSSHVLQSNSAAPSYGESAAASGASGAAMGGPMGAAIGVGGSLLVNYLNNKAREAEARKQAEMQLNLKHGEDQKEIMGNLMNNWRQALGK